MDDHERGFGKNLLQGLKKVLFTPDPESGESATGSPTRVGQQPTAGTQSTSSTGDASASTTGSSTLAGDAIASTTVGQASAQSDQDAVVTKEMKDRVYELLGNLNREGVDFYEVWKAAEEMGGASAANIRAAYTSLRFADRKLSKDSLLRSGRDYVQALQRVIETESAKRLQEKSALEQEREDTRARLDAEARRLASEISALQEKLASLQDQRQRIDDTYDPRIIEITSKIDAGRKAVDAVLDEMRAVIGIMERDIN